MCKKLLLLGVLVFTLAVAAPSQATVFTDDFNTPYDYLQNGVIGSTWDGFIGMSTGVGPGETIDVLDANMTNAPNDVNVKGVLYVQSTTSNWDPPFMSDPRGPLLYKIVDTGDFIATVQVKAFLGCWYTTRTLSNDSGIMARVADVNAAGAGEDHVTMNFFPTWPTNYGRSVNNGGETEFGQLWEGCPALGGVGTFLQLSRTGNDFKFERGDGSSFTELAGSPVTRADMNGQLQVGLLHTMYSTNTGYVAYDNFSLTAVFPPHYSAYGPWPVDRHRLEWSPTAAIRWKPGDSATSHWLYISTSYADVNNRTVPKIVLANASYLPPSGHFAVGLTYYWAVDEQGGGGPWKGPVWRFNTQGKTKNPDPRDYKGNIDVNLPKLKWTTSPLALKQDIYFGTIEATVRSATHNQAQLKDYAGNYPDVNTNQVTTLPMTKGLTFFWRVDSNCGVLGVAKGDVWRFSTAFPIQACDNFTYGLSGWNFKKQGTVGSKWDGIVGLEYVILMQTAPPPPECNTGKLYIRSSNSTWAGDAHGVLLYKELLGNFYAKIKVTNMEGLYVGRGTELGTNNAGIMARVGDLAAAGPGEDWFSTDFFPGWGVGNILRFCDDSNRYEVGIEGNGWDGDRQLQIERADNLFFSSHSPDGTTWNYSPASPILRNDMNGLAVQVGPQHATFGGTSSFVEYDDFCYGRNAIYKAYSPVPNNGADLDKMRGMLSWAPSDFTPLRTQQFLYYGTDPNALVSKGNANITGPDASGRFNYDAGTLELPVIGSTYYWCVNEVNVITYKGDKWRFKVQDYTTIEDFERFTNTGGVPALGVPADGTLRDTWTDGWHYQAVGSSARNGAFAQINVDTYDGIYDANNVVSEGAQSMHMYYDNDGGTYYWLNALYGITPLPACPNQISEVAAAIDDAARFEKSGTWIQASLGLKRDWSAYKLLRISFYGDPLNTTTSTDKLFVGLVDSSPLTSVVTVSYSTADVLKEKGLHEWYIKLSDFSAGGISLTDVARIYIGVGDRVTKPLGGKGGIFIDNIVLYANGVCVPDVYDLKEDLTRDCKVNEDDLQVMVHSIPGDKAALPLPIIDVNTTGLALGPITQWLNKGTEGGRFVDGNTADNNTPVVAMVNGKKAVVFDTNDVLIWVTGNNPTDPCVMKTAPHTLTSDHNYPADANTFTVIYEVWNSDIADQEWLLNWARRGTDTWCAGFGYGTDTTWGAVVHYGTDMGFDAYVPPAAKWHTIGVTYDDKTQIEVVAVDGMVQSVEKKGNTTTTPPILRVDVHPDDPVTIGAPYNSGYGRDEPNWPGIWNNQYIPVFTGMRYTGAVSSIKVYGDAIPAGNLALWTGSLADIFADTKLNFKDYAVMAYDWLVGPLLLQ